jgi:hypothetical protein
MDMGFVFFGVGTEYYEDDFWLQRINFIEAV